MQGSSPQKKKRAAKTMTTATKTERQARFFCPKHHTTTTQFLHHTGTTTTTFERRVVGRQDASSKTKHHPPSLRPQRRQHLTSNKRSYWRMSSSWCTTTSVEEKGTRTNNLPAPARRRRAVSIDAEEGWCRHHAHQHQDAAGALDRSSSGLCNVLQHNDADTWPPLGIRRKTSIPVLDGQEEGCRRNTHQISTLLQNDRRRTVSTCDSRIMIANRREQHVRSKKTKKKPRFPPNPVSTVFVFDPALSPDVGGIVSSPCSPRIAPGNLQALSDANDREYEHYLRGCQAVLRALRERRTVASC